MRLRSVLLCAAALAALLGGIALAKDKDRFLPPPPGPDRDYYVARVAPWIDANCASCHRQEGAGGFRLEPVRDGMSEERRRRADFERVVPFVNRQVPWESRLLLKVLEPADGGDPHVGGAFLEAESDDHDMLLDFVSGATPANVAPEVWFENTEVRAKPGEKVIVDGRDSYDRDIEDMDKLAYWWELYARPAESRVAILDRRASRLEFEPDTGGSYVFRLRVGDGKVWSAPRAVTVEVFDRVKVVRTKPGGISGLDDLEEANLRRLRRIYLDVLGRSPTPGEALAEGRRSIKSLVGNVLLRAEMGRAWVEEVGIRFGLYDDFRPVSEEATDLALRIPAENLPPHVVESVLARDPSFLRRHPPGRPLAEAIGRLLLGRAPTVDEIVAANRLAAGEAVTLEGLGNVSDPRAWLVKVLDSEAFLRASIQRRLARFLDSGDVTRRFGRALGAVREGNKAWREYLQSVLLDRAYLNRRTLRPKGAVTFLRSLFIDLLERKPTDRELAALVRAIEAMDGETAAFAALVRIMIDSGEAPLPLLVDIEDAPRWIKDRFLRYLGRPPTVAELKAYGQVLLHPQGGPEVVVQALLTGPEYACR